MAIRVSETARVFQVPYEASALRNSEGTPDDGFINLKANPAWAGVIPPCIGWPETADLLRAVNAPEGPLMTLAADQGVTGVEQGDLKAALVSFVVLCYADLTRNQRAALSGLAEAIKPRLDELVLSATDEVGQDLHLSVVLELQPTVFREQRVEGWSLSVLMAAYGEDEGAARLAWRLAMMALQQALTTAS